jgi:ABC-type Fe3+/spermidine/putrescine transport system ATPase subunit
MLKAENISFSYINETNINNVSFTVSKGANFAIIGESGCGKSTLLKVLYGLYDLKGGNIFWDSIEVLGPKYHLIPGMPFMKYLAQDFDLMPFISVAENVGKYLSNFFPEEKQARIAELLEIVEMTNYANTKAKLLSGGQMQRVALAKVLALEPEVLLLDEPFSHIDNFRKNSLRRKLFAYLKQKNITCIVATHDSTDVLSFADEALILKDGETIAIGKPKEIYNQLNDKYIASLFGDVNEFVFHGKQYLIYPHQLKITNNSDLLAEVQFSYFRGNQYLIEAKFENQTLFFESEKELETGSKVFFTITNEN